MTIPFFIEHNYQKVEVPQEILHYCDSFTPDADREDLRYIDCVYMNMGYYGNDPELLKRIRQEHFYQPQPIFD